MSWLAQIIVAVVLFFSWHGISKDVQTQQRTKQSCSYNSSQTVQSGLTKTESVSRMGVLGLHLQLQLTNLAMKNKDENKTVSQKRRTEGNAVWPDRLKL